MLLRACFIKYAMEYIYIYITNIYSIVQLCKFLSSLNFRETNLILYKKKLFVFKRNENNCKHLTCQVFSNKMPKIPDLFQKILTFILLFQNSEVFRIYIENLINLYMSSRCTICVAVQESHISCQQARSRSVMLPYFYHFLTYCVLQQKFSFSFFYVSM